jgi:hypothetical protein
MRKIRFYGQQIKFPPACAYCLKAVHKEFNFEQTFTYGKQSIILQLPVPLCRQHYQQASAQSPAQIWCERIGQAGGALLALAILLALTRYWSLTSQGIIILNLFIAFLAGTSVGVVLWAVTKFWMAPLFAFPETKAVIKSVQMKKYNPTRRILEIAFQNETMAELTLRENLSILVLEDENQQKYHISAHLLDDDIRWSGRIDTHILLDHFPSPQEAEQFLQPVVECFMIRQLGTGILYEISDVNITMDN